MKEPQGFLRKWDEEATTRIAFSGRGGGHGGARRRGGSSFRETGSFHCLAHLGVALVHEGREFGRITPYGSEAAIAHEVLELLGVVDLLQCPSELGRDICGQALRTRNAAPRAGRIV